jgi:nucleoside-diphosphate-sugar epimerase
MKTLIIGGSGLISTSITRMLVERGEEITLFNRGKTALRVDGPIEVIQGDRTDFPRFEAQMAALGHIDCVIDMVCFDPLEAESVIHAFKGRIGQYLFCSSVTVYNKSGQGYPYDEQAPRDQSVGGYAHKKSLCEDIFLAAHARGDLPVTILRPGATYGEGGGIIHSFGLKTTYIDRLRKGKPIIVLGDGQSLWVTCHADDVARGFLGAKGNTKALGQAYNVTGEEWLTWNRHHQKVAEAIGAPMPTLIHIPTDLLGAIAPQRAAPSVNDLQYTNIFDNSAAHRDLGFRYTIPWSEGVPKVVAWLDANGRVENSDDDPFDDQVIDAWRSVTAQLPSF